jgi:two-component system, OmpR family, alkaline phosphatase synthesis response regulator PhoP
MKTILIVDDEEDIVELIEYNLKKAGYKTISCFDGEAALILIKKNKPDLVLLDWMLPKLEGIDVCKLVKNQAETQRLPIIMISAKGDEFDKVLALEMGADDYLCKPISQRELVARIKAVLRRTIQSYEQTAATGLLRFGELAIDAESYEASIQDKNLQLTKTEFDLLSVLAQNPSKVYTRDQLLYRVWGDDFFGDNRVVDVHIRRLRSKLEVLTTTEYVKTVHGVGYRFNLTG